MQISSWSEVASISLQNVQRNYNIPKFIKLQQMNSSHSINTFANINKKFLNKNCNPDASILHNSKYLHN
jgi:hypothetical protein